MSKGPLDERLGNLSKEDLDNVSYWLEEDRKKAKYCVRCNNRCDAAFGGNDVLCLSCWSKPTQETMSMFIGRR